MGGRGSGGARVGAGRPRKDAASLHLAGTWRADRHAGRAAVAPFPARPASAEIPRAPSHLSARARGIWRDVLTEWQLTSAQIALLLLACEALDRAEAARVVCAREGLVLDGAAHPCVRIAEAATTTYRQCLAALDLREG